MPEEQTITAPPPESVVEETTSKATEPSPQGAAQPQEGSQPQGRETEQQPSSNGEARKPSDFYRERNLYRNRVEKLQQEVENLKTLIASKNNEKPAPPQPSPSFKFDWDKFTTKPVETLAEILSEREKLLREEIRKEFTESLPRVLSETESKKELERARQDALELIFPKSGTDDKRSLKERIEASPEQMQKAIEIQDRFNLQSQFDSHPKETAMLIMEILSKQRPQIAKNPNVIKKSLVGSVATGGTIQSGDKKMATLNEIKAQLKTLDDEVDKNPDFRFEDSYKTKKAELMGQLSVLTNELKKGQ